MSHTFFYHQWRLAICWSNQPWDINDGATPVRTAKRIPGAWLCFAWIDCWYYWWPFTKTWTVWYVDLSFELSLLMGVTIWTRNLWTPKSIAGVCWNYLLVGKQSKQKLDCYQYYQWRRPLVLEPLINLPNMSTLIIRYWKATVRTHLASQQIRSNHAMVVCEYLSEIWQSPKSIIHSSFQPSPSLPSTRKTKKNLYSIVLFHIVLCYCIAHKTKRKQKQQKLCAGCCLPAAGGRICARLGLTGWPLSRWCVKSIKYCYCNYNTKYCS